MFLPSLKRRVSKIPLCPIRAHHLLMFFATVMNSFTNATFILGWMGAYCTRERFLCSHFVTHDELANLGNEGEQKGGMDPNQRPLRAYYIRLDSEI